MGCFYQSSSFRAQGAVWRKRQTESQREGMCQGTRHKRTDSEFTETVAASTSSSTKGMKWTLGPIPKHEAIYNGHRLSPCHQQNQFSPIVSLSISTKPSGPAPGAVGQPSRSAEHNSVLFLWALSFRFVWHYLFHWSFPCLF